MRIAVDARELVHRPTGVGRYLSELLVEWAADEGAGRHDWRLYAHRPLGLPAPWSSCVRSIGGSGGTAWEQWTLARALARDGADVLFAPGYTAPLATGVPTALTVHDVSFLAHPEWFSWREGWRRRFVTTRAARRARLVLTDSAFSRDEIARHIGLSGARVRVVPLGMRAGRGAGPGPESGDRSPDQAPREKLVLFVGSIFARRRVDRLIASFDAVVDRLPDARLEIVGENRTSHPRLDLEALAAGRRHAAAIRVRSYVDEATLAGLYARASAFVFLSEYEGFGLTPLEALAAGVPPLLLDTPVGREVCGPAARYVAPSAANDDIASAIVELLANEGARRAILQQASAAIDRHQWARTAAATLAAIEEAARGR